MSESIILQPGRRAPDFELQEAPGVTVRLSDHRGSSIVVVFYPSDFSPICSDQLVLYNEVLPEFERFRARCFAISVDGPWCHQAFRKERRLSYPLLSDFEPKGEVARKYGVYRTEGVSERALFVIDEEGIIRWSHLAPIDRSPGAQGILSALESL